MSENLYAAPKSDPTPLPNPVEVPPEILKKIRQGCIAAIAYAAVMLALISLAIFFEIDALKMDMWDYVAVPFMLFLAHRVYRKKDRYFSVFIFVYPLYVILADAQFGDFPNGALVGIFFSYHLWQGMRATFQYHKIVAGET